MNHRSQRVADKVRSILARLLREELRDPRIGFVTLTDVRLSPDLRYARAFVSFLDEETAAPLKALQHAAPYLRRLLAREAGLRHAPELRFEIDESISTGFRVERILDEIDDGEDRGETPPGDGDEPS